ncbi:Hypothetical protein FKW44_010305 [Caligus rogercresseyi]|uniref:Uncharacterized protein n=1 Tax=Caligus rogercresseyi TaxID=217165 RepID=A0A7T8K9G1_CALRO|nr:Hypothetical protein FKW44_010305 [Caligus rogercresseyi]
MAPVASRDLNTVLIRGRDITNFNKDNSCSYTKENKAVLVWQANTKHKQKKGGRASREEIA